MTNGNTLQWYFWMGLIAAICIAAYMVPQLIKAIKTKDTTSISVVMIILATVGDLFFVINGIGILCDQSITDMTTRISSGLPLLLANLFGFIISGVITFFKIRSMLWAKKFNINEKDIPAHYAEIKNAVKKARAEKKLAKANEAEQKSIEEIKRDTPVKDDSSDIKFRN